MLGLAGLGLPSRATRAWAAAVWAAGVGLALFLGLLTEVARNSGAAAAAIAVLAVGAFYARAMGWRLGLVVLLIVAATADRFTFPVGPVALRAEQVAALAALAAVAVVVVRGRRWELLKPSLAEALLLAWFAINLVSSLVASPDKHLSAKILALFLVCSLGLFLPRRLLAGASAGRWVEAVAGWLLIAFATEAAYGVLGYLLHVFGPTVGIGENLATGHLSAYGTLWEQNLFGAYCAAGLIAWAYLGPRRFRGAWLAIAACIGGLTASLTRAAWLAAGAVAALGLAINSVRRRLDLPQLLPGAGAGAVLVAAILLVERVGQYTFPIPTPGVTGSTTAGSGFLGAVLNRIDLLGRWDQVLLVQDDLRGHLFLGRGTAGFEVLHQVNGAFEHLATLPLFVVDGTGVIGLAVFTAFAAAVAWRAWRYRHDRVAFALGQVALLVLITNLATENLELMIGWLLIGLLLAAVDSAAISI